MPEMVTDLRSKCGFSWVLVTLLAVLSGCGLGVDNEARLQRGEEAFAEHDYRAAMIDAKSVLQQEPDNVKARLLLGRASIYLGDPKAAEKELRRAIELGADDSNAVIELGQALLMQGEFQQILDNFDPQQMQDESARMAMIELHGNAYLGLGDAASARREFGQIPESDERYLDALLGISASHVAEQNYDMAFQLLETALSVDPDHFSALLALASLNLKTGNAADAERIYQDVVGLARATPDRPTEIIALTGLVEAQLAGGDLPAARQSVASLAALTTNGLPAQYLTARIAYEEGDWQAAQDILQELARTAPDYVSIKILLGAVHYRKGNLAQAEAYLSAAVASQPDSVDARKMLAETQLRMRKASDAVEVLKPITGDGALDANAMILAARASMNAGDLDGATEYLQRSIESNPEDIDLRLNLAAAYLVAGNIDKTTETLTAITDSGAEPHFRLDALKILTLLRTDDSVAARAAADELVSDWPDDPNAHNLVAGVYLSLGEVERARRSFVRVTEIAPNSAAALVNLGRFDASQGNVTAARTQFETALIKAPGHSPAMVALARLSMNEQDAEGALAWLKQAIEADPGALTARILLGRYDLANDRFPDAQQVAEAGLEIDDFNADLLHILGLAMLAQDSSADALVALRRAATIKPASAVLGFHYASALLATGKNDEATTEFRRVVAAHPAYVPSAEALVAIEARAGNDDKATAIIAELQRLQPDRAAPFALSGDYHWSRQQYKESARAYDLALSKENDRGIAVRAFRMRTEAGMADPSEPLRRYLQQEPSDNDASLLLAQFFQTQGDGSRARQQYEAILESDPANAIAGNNLAWLYFEQGDPKAVELARNAYSHAGEDSNVIDTLGWILVNTGSADEGVELLRTAARIDSSSPDIRYHLAAGLAELDDSDAAVVLLRELLASEQDFAGREDAMTLLETL